jgi:hypothetical protein
MVFQAGRNSQGRRIAAGNRNFPLDHAIVNRDKGDAALSEGTKQKRDLIRAHRRSICDVRGIRL